LETRVAERDADTNAHTNAPLDERSDAVLGAALHLGDEAALASLYDRHLPGVYDFLARYLRDPHSAEDLAQTTFVRAWERRETLRKPEGVRAWLFTIAHNLATNQLTRTRRAEPIEEKFDLAAPEPGPEQEAVTREAAELVWDAASSLEARQYAVLDLCIRRELSTREVAEVMEIPVGHAAVLVNRAKEALGNAVRFLLVAQRRDQCDRLAALVPDGVRKLTPELRSAVDHHMRRCDACRNLSRRLTSPAELFGGLIALPVPGSLRGDGRDYVLASARRPEAGSGPPLSRRQRLLRRGAMLAGLALLVLSTLAVVHQRSDASSPGAPASSSPGATPLHGSAEPSSGTPAPAGAPPTEQPASGAGTPSVAPTALPTSGAGAGSPSTSPVPTTSPATAASPTTAPTSASTSGVALPFQPPQPTGRYRPRSPVLSP
jgi:RNA polymerase sigma factor (sigma-70 family)